MKYHEGFLAQIIIYSLIWLYDDYVGLVFSLIMCSILLALLIFAYMVEFIENMHIKLDRNILGVLQCQGRVLKVSLFIETHHAAQV